MSTPSPGCPRQRLHSLLGSWEGEEVMHPSTWMPEGGRALGRLDARLGCEGFNVIVDYEQRQGETRTFIGHGVYFHDRQSDEYVLHWYDSHGGGCDVYRGRWEDGVLTMIAHNARGTFRMIADHREEGVNRQQMEMRIGDEAFRPMMTVEYRRRD